MAAGTFSFETILTAIYKSFTLKKNKVAVIHLLSGLALFTVFAVPGSLIGYEPLNIVLSAVGSLLMYYVLIRMSYILSFFALQENLTKNDLAYPKAVEAFAKQRWTALLVPVIFATLLAAVIGLQVLILKALDLVPWAGAILNALLLLPFFIINFFLLIVIFFGGNIVYGILITEQTNIWTTIRAVCELIIRKARFILIYWLLVSMLILTTSLVLVVFSVLALLPALSGALSNLIPMLHSGINMNFMFNSGLLSELINPVAAVIMFINLALVTAFLLSFLINIQVGVNIAIYCTVQEAGKEKKK